MLRIYPVVLDVAREVGVIGRQIARYDSDLARQVRRAMASVPLNLAEGMGQAAGNRTRHYRIALGSMREVLAGVQTAGRSGTSATSTRRSLTASTTSARRSSSSRERQRSDDRPSAAAVSVADGFSPRPRRRR